MLLGEIRGLFLKIASGKNRSIWFLNGTTVFSIQMESARELYCSIWRKILTGFSIQMGSAHCLLFSLFFPLATGCTFSRAYHRLHIFPRLAPVPYFPALGTGYIFSRAWRRLHIFPRLAPATYFPALGAGCIFSRAWYWLHVAAFGAIGQRWFGFWMCAFFSSAWREAFCNCKTLFGEIRIACLGLSTGLLTLLLDTLVNKQ